MIITVSGQPFRDLFVLGRQLVAEIVLLCLSRLLPDHTARQTLRVDTHHLLLQQLPVKVVASQVVVDCSLIDITCLQQTQASYAKRKAYMPCNMGHLTNIQWLIHMRNILDEKNSCCDKIHSYFSRRMH